MKIWYTVSNVKTIVPHLNAMKPSSPCRLGQKILLFLASSMLVASTWAWTEAETNMVGLALAEVTALDSGCDGGPLPPDDPMANEPLDELLPTFESLFEIDLPCATNWATEAKRAAFFHYLDTLPGSVTNGVFCGDEWFASSALGFCRVKGDAAVLQPAMGVLAATNVPDNCRERPSWIALTCSRGDSHDHISLGRAHEITRCAVGQTSLMRRQRPPRQRRRVPTQMTTT